MRSLVLILLFAGITPSALFSVDLGPLPKIIKNEKGKCLGVYLTREQLENLETSFDEASQILKSCEEQQALPNTEALRAKKEMVESKTPAKSYIDNMKTGIGIDARLGAKFRLLVRQYLTKDVGADLTALYRRDEDRNENYNELGAFVFYDVMKHQSGDYSKRFYLAFGAEREVHSMDRVEYAPLDINDPASDFGYVKTRDIETRLHLLPSMGFSLGENIVFTFGAGYDFLSVSSNLSSDDVSYKSGFVFNANVIYEISWKKIHKIFEERKRGVRK